MPQKNSASLDLDQFVWICEATLSLLNDQKSAET
jgi:hypothetical protein